MRRGRMLDHRRVSFTTIEGRMRRNRMMESQHTEESTDSRMESLLDEVIMEILSRVPTLGLPKLRYVCKRWNNILKDPLFRGMHRSHCVSNLNENRVLISLTPNGELYMDMADKMRPRGVVIALSPSLLYLNFIGSCNGLLCLGGKQYLSGIIINPFTCQHVFFTANPESLGTSVRSWGFGFDEIAKSYKVVAVVEKRGNHREFQVRVCDLGSNGSTNWRDRGMTTISSKSPAFLFNGRLHWTHLTNGSMSIMSFDLGDEKFRPILLPDPLHDSVIDVIDFDMIVFRGCLCIFHSQGSHTPEIQIWIMKEYGIKASWVKEFAGFAPIPRSLDFNVNNHPGGRLDLMQYHRKFFKALGCVRDDEIVLLKKISGTYKEAVLFFDSTFGEYKLLRLDMQPYENGSIIHTVSLNWI